MKDSPTTGHARTVAAAVAAAAFCAAAARAEVIAVAPATMPPIAIVDPRYQSYNVEMAEIVGGKFWKPYAARKEATTTAARAGDLSKPASKGLQIGQDPSMFVARPPVDLSNARLRKLAAALGPAYLA